jgi:hypothetical protein
MFIPDPGSDFFSIPDPGPEFFHPGSRIRIKEFQYFNPKKWFLSSRKYDPGWSSRIPDPDPYFLPIPDPESRGQKCTGSRIRILNTEEEAMSFLLSSYFGSLTALSRQLRWRKWLPIPSILLFLLPV